MKFTARLNHHVFMELSQLNHAKAPCFHMFSMIKSPQSSFFDQAQAVCVPSQPPSTGADVLRCHRWGRRLGPRALRTLISKKMVFSKFSMWQCVKTCQNLVPLVNIKIAGINRYWSIPMSFPVDKLIRFDKYPSIFGAPREVTHTCEAQRSEMDGRIMEDVSKLVCLRTYGIGLRKQRKLEQILFGLWQDCSIPWGKATVQETCSNQKSAGRMKQNKWIQMKPPASYMICVYIATNINPGLINHGLWIRVVFPQKSWFDTFYGTFPIQKP